MVKQLHNFSSSTPLDDEPSEIRIPENGLINIPKKLICCLENMCVYIKNLMNLLQLSREIDAFFLCSLLLFLI